MVPELGLIEGQPSTASGSKKSRIIPKRSGAKKRPAQTPASAPIPPESSLSTPPCSDDPRPDAGVIAARLPSERSPSVESIEYIGTKLAGAGPEDQQGDNSSNTQVGGEVTNHSPYR